MKILFLIVFFNFIALSQNDLVLLLSGGVIYNGTELITDEINRGFEPVSAYASNFSVNTDSWTGSGYTIAGNKDGVFGRDNVLGGIATATGTLQFRRSFTITSGKTHKLSYSYFVQTLGGTANYSITGNGGAGSWLGTTAASKGSWVSGSVVLVTDANTAAGTRFYTYTTNTGDSVYIGNFDISLYPYLTSAGNHSFDSSSTIKSSGSYSVKVIASGAGDGTTNTITLPSTQFTAVTSGLNYRFQVYAYTSTANTTLTFKLGDIVKTAIVPTTGMSLLTFDFKATASTTGDILLYLDKAATVYIDEVSLKSGS